MHRTRRLRMLRCHSRIAVVCRRNIKCCSEGSHLYNIAHTHTRTHARTTNTRHMPHYCKDLEWSMCVVRIAYAHAITIDWICYGYGQGTRISSNIFSYPSESIVITYTTNWIQKACPDEKGISCMITCTVQYKYTYHMIRAYAYFGAFCRLVIHQLARSWQNTKSKTRQKKEYKNRRYG